MDGVDEVIHQATRLRIMAILNALPRGELVEFARLKAILKVTDGNLGAHIGALEKAGYVAVEKDFHGKRPRTRVAMTRDGRRAFEAHVAYLREILESPAGEAV